MKNLRQLRINKALNKLIDIIKNLKISEESKIELIEALYDLMCALKVPNETKVE